MIYALFNLSLNSPKFNARKAATPFQTYRIKPELGLGLPTLHVDMRRFISIRRIKE